MSTKALGTIGTVAIILLVIVLLVGAIINQVKIGPAVERFKTLAETEKIEVVRHSNNAFVFGDPFDVAFELKIDGKPVGGRCTSRVFSPMVCRLYEGD